MGIFHCYVSLPEGTPRFLRNILSAIAALSFAWARWAQKKSQAMVPMVPRLQRRVRRKQMVMQPLKFQGPVILARLFLQQNVELQYQRWPTFVTNILISLDFCIPNSKISKRNNPKLQTWKTPAGISQHFFVPLGISQAEQQAEAQAAAVAAAAQSIERKRKTKPQVVWCCWCCFFPRGVNF